MAKSLYTLQVQGVLNDKQIRAQLKSLERQFGKIGTTSSSTGKNSGLNNVNDQLTSGTRKAKTFGATFASNTKKVAMFGASTAILGAVTSGIGMMVKNVVTLDASLTELKKVTTLSGSDLDAFTDKAYEAGRGVAKTGTEMIDASTEFAKAGYKDQALDLAKVSTMFQNIADTEISAGDSASFIISQMKAFNISADDAMTIIDQVNEVSNNFAVGSNDIQLALTKTSSALGTLGNTSSETIGLVTAGTEIMTGQASKVGRGLRTVGINISKLAQTTDTWTSANGKVSVSLKDKNGDLRSTFDIMKDLYPQWGKLTKSEKSSLAQNIAGKNQFEVFTAVMNNFSTAIDANETAIGSQGSAQKENAKVLESVKGKLQKLKSSFEELSYELLSSDMLKFGLSVADGFIKILKAGNAIIPKILLAAGALKLFFAAGKGLKKLLFIEQFAGFFKKNAAMTDVDTAATDINTRAKQANAAASEEQAVANGTTTGATTKLSSAAGKAKGAFAGLGIEMGILAGAGLLTIFAFDALVPTVEKDQKEIDTLKDSLSGLKKKISDLNAKKKAGSITKDEQATLNIYKEQRDVQLEIYKLKQKDKKEHYGTKDQNTSKSGVTRAGSAGTSGGGSETNKLKDDLKKSLAVEKDYQNKIQQAEAEGQDARASTFTKNLGYIEDEKKATKLAIIAKKKEYEDTYGKKMKGATDDQKADYAWLTKQVDEYNRGTDAIEAYSKAISKGTDGFKGFKKNNESALKGVADLSGDKMKLDPTKFSDFANAMNLTDKEARALIKTMSSQGDFEWDIDVKGAVDSLSKLDDVTEDSNGKITLSKKTITRWGKSFGLTKNQIQAYINALNKSGNTVVDFGLKGKSASKQFAKLGNSFGVVADKAGNINKVNVGTFVKSSKKAGASANEMLSSMQQIAAANPNVKFTVDGEQYTVDQLEVVKGKIQVIPSEKKMKVKTDIRDSVSKINTVNKKDVKGKHFKVNAQVADAINKVGNVDKKTIKSKTFSIKASLSGLSTKIKKILGFAKGTKNAPEGTALVNEDGAEIHQTKHGAYIPNNGKPAIVHLDKGDKIYTAKQTKEMLKGGSASNYMPRYAKGKSSGTSDAKKKRKEYIQKKWDNYTSAQDYNLSMDKISETTYYKRLQHKAKTKIKYKGKKYRYNDFLSTDQKRSIATTAHDTIKDAFGDTMSDIVAKVSAGTRTTKQAVGALNIAKKKHKISYSEYKDYLKQIYNAKIDSDEELYEAGKKSYSSMKTDLAQYLKDGKISYEDYYSALKTLNEKHVESQKSLLESYADLQTKAIDKQIESLQALKDESDNIEELTGLEEDLATAKSKVIGVYKDGKLVQVQDTEAVNTAQKALDDYKKDQEYDAQIDALQELSDSWSDYIEDVANADELKTLEKTSEMTIQQIYDSVGGDLDKFKEKYSDVTKLSNDTSNAVMDNISQVTLSSSVADTVASALSTNTGVLNNTLLKTSLSSLTPSNQTTNTTEFNFSEGSIVVNGENGEQLAESIMTNLNRIVQQTTNSNI